MVNGVQMITEHNIGWITATCAAVAIILLFAFAALYWSVTP